MTVPGMVIVGVLPDAATTPVAVAHCQSCSAQPAGTVSVMLAGSVGLVTVNAVLVCGLVVVVAKVKVAGKPFVPPVKSKLPVPPTVALRMVMVGFLVLVNVQTPTVPVVAVSVAVLVGRSTTTGDKIPAEAAQLMLVRSKPAPTVVSVILKPTLPELGTLTEEAMAPVPLAVVIDGVLITAFVAVLVTVYPKVPLPPTEFLTMVMSTFLVFRNVQFTSAPATRLTMTFLVAKSLVNTLPTAAPDAFVQLIAARLKPFVLGVEASVIVISVFGGAFNGVEDTVPPVGGFNETVVTKPPTRLKSNVEPPPSAVLEIVSLGGTGVTVKGFARKFFRPQESVTLTVTTQLVLAAITGAINDVLDEVAPEKVPPHELIH